MRRRPRPSSCARPSEGRLDPEAVDAVLAAAGHRGAAATPRAAVRSHRARAGDPPRARARQVQPGDRRRSPHLRQDGRKPRPARLREGRRSQPRRGDALGVRARPRSHRIGHSPHSARASGGAHSLHHRRRPAGPRTQEEETRDPGNDTGRGLRPLPGASSRPRAPRSASSTGRRARPSSAIRTRPTGSGCSSTGTPTAGRASSPTRMSRRSCRRPGTRAAPRPRGSAATTTRRPTARRESEPLPGGFRLSNAHAVIRSHVPPP